ncbi:MAG: YwaF family protein [Bacilli bacterium]|nr:YwaF family protein [Bacilli bacterium]MDY4052533.1 YwaF family protein [Bacilli bacterium]
MLFLENIFSFKTEYFKGNVTFQVAVILLTIIISHFLTRKKSFNIDRTVFIFGLIFFVLELYKQLFYNVFSERNGYHWNIFPFQLCSTPLYVCLIAPFTKGKIRNAFYVYLSSFCMLGGLSVLIFPSSVIVSEISITFQSMIWHSSMVCLACYLIYNMDYGKSLIELKPGVYVFLIVVTMAILMNDTFEFFKQKYHLTNTFNLFFISPYYECHIIGYEIIWNNTTWYVSVLAYVLGLCLGSIIIWKVVKLKEMLNKNYVI